MIIFFKGKSTGGFTLMEVLIAITILAIVLAIVYGSFVQTRRVISSAEASVSELRGVRAAFNRLTRDINMAFVTKPPGSNTDNPTIFVGTDDYAYGYANDSIDFTAFSNNIRKKDAKESDQMEVGYYIKRNFEGKSVLMKREKRRVDSSPLYGGKSFEISEDIVGLNFRFLEKETWLDNWDSRVSNTLIPEAVEITIIIKDIKEVERSYRTIIEIPFGNT